ncbi:MAG: hypothetical protein HN390_12615 [Anaerolineae bacterium]|jgi:hypothetical protein|nr:hypothetical protein [Anaerolineae bacterium]MBT7189277.1 hypothetical protein [Anaerolineae bacterium]MBT7990125.1 hypothetical protein [Anaerolineae bacterium]
MIKMIGKFKIQMLVVILMLAAFALQACAQFAVIETDVPQASPAPNDTATWTPRPKEPTAPPTATKTPISNTPTPALAPTQAKETLFSVTGGNLNVRRGPDLAYNYLGVMYDGDEAVAIGRDRKGDWLLIELPSKPGVEGWVTTETEYSTVEGNIRSLPIVEVEEALPAFIRNCTKHTILVQPVEIQLLDKYNEPDNVGHFDVATYQIYDVDISGNVRLEDVSLSEGRTVDIIYDGNGDKSKCE